MRTDRPTIVSFSGIDGAGKSTQISALIDHLQGLGLKVRICTFWDDIVAFSRFREFISVKAFKGEKGVGSPERPVRRRDKNVSSWYVTAARLFLYALDALSLCLAVARLSRSDADFIVFDRYIYDELANLPLDHAPIKLFVRGLMHFTPRPDVAYLLDADPRAARLRKPEYPLEFLRKNRNAHLALSEIGGMRVIRGMSEQETSSQVFAWIAVHAFVLWQIVPPTSFLQSSSKQRAA
jgi:thymidylate kinase